MLILYPVITLAYGTASGFAWSVGGG
jgi:hypothetical protein